MPNAPVVLLKAGEYRLGRKLGSGGCGAVFAGVHIPTGQRVAIKQRTAGAAERFAREGRLLCDRTLRTHPHAKYVVAGREQFSDRGIDYLVMDFVAGATLRDDRYRGISLRTGCRLLGSVLKGLEFLHSIGCVHRDVKPLNLIHAPDSAQDKYCVCIVDLGIARIDDGLDLTVAGLGTYRFSAPECLTNPTRVQPSADLYSVAATLYYLLIGSAPGVELDPRGDRRDYARLTELTQAWEPQRLAELRRETPRSLCDLVHRTMSKDPLMRPQSVAEFQQAAAVPLADIERVSRQRRLPEYLRNALVDLLHQAKREAAMYAVEQNLANSVKRCRNTLAKISVELGGNLASFLQAPSSMTLPLNVAPIRDEFLECIQWIFDRLLPLENGRSQSDFHQFLEAAEQAVRRCVAVESRLWPIARTIG